MKNGFLKVFLIVLILIAALYFAHLAIRNIGAVRINARFDTLRPFGGHADVYYKGYKVGRSLRIYPADDYKQTVMEIALYPKNLSLPKNIQIQLRKKTVLFKFQHDYVEIISPDEPVKERLASGDTIKGTTTVDVKDYFASQDPYALDEIKENLKNASKDLDNMLISLSDLFSSLDETVRNSQMSIQKSAKNMEITTSNIAQISTKLNRALSQGRIDNSAGNIDITTDYIKQSAKNIEGITDNLNSLSRDLKNQSGEINSIIKNTNSVLSNASSITGGVNSTLKKRFGGFRLIFGRAVNN